MNRMQPWVSLCVLLKDLKGFPLGFECVDRSFSERPKKFSGNFAMISAPVNNHLGLVPGQESKHIAERVLIQPFDAALKVAYTPLDVGQKS